MYAQRFWKTRIGQHAVLNPLDRISEVLYGLIIALSFTGAISVAEAKHQHIDGMLSATIGSSVAWGMVDAIMYLVNVLLERGHVLSMIVRMAGSDVAASRQMLKGETTLAKVMTDEELDRLVARLKDVPPPAKNQLLTWRDVASALQIFGLVVLCTLPVAMPFIFMDDIKVAVRISNGIAILLLLVGGYLLGGYAGFRRLPTALVYTAIGVSLVAVTIVLGG